MRKTLLLFKRRWQLMLFLLPAVVYALIFSYYPMYGVQIAFRDYSVQGGIANSAWTGIKHFERFFESFQFMNILVNTLRVSLYGTLVGFPLSIITALSINVVRKKAFKSAVQTITYMPHFISVVVLVGMITQILNPVKGLYGTLFRMLGGSGYPPDILSSGDAFVHLYVWSGLWQNLGWNTIIYLSALSSADPELHEAAQIDGASRLSRVIHIDYPTLLPTATIMLIMSAGSVMSIGFEKAYLMQNDMNIVTSEMIATYVYKTGLSSGFSKFSYATAIGLFNSVVNAALLVIFNALSKRISSDSNGLF